METSETRFRETGPARGARRRRSVTLVACVIVLLGPTRAEAVEATLTLEGALATAQANNAELSAAHSNLDVLRAQVVSAGAFPNPELSGNGAPAVPDADEYDYSVGIDQQIPILGKRSKRIAVAGADLERESMLVADLERRIAQQVRGVFRRAQVIDRRAALAKDLAGLNERLFDVASARFRRGEVSELDVRQFEIELAQRRQEAQRLGAERASALLELSRLMNVRYDPALHLAPRLAGIAEPVALAPLLEAAAQRPDLTALTVEAGAAERERTLRLAERWGDPVVGVFYRRERSRFDEPAVIEDTDDFVGIQVRVPLPLLYRNQGETAAAEARKRTAELRRAALELEIDRTVRDAHQRATVQLIAVRELEHTIEAAGRAERLAERAYANGQVSTVQLIQTQQQRFALVDASLDALDAYYQALSELEGAVNAPLEEFAARSSEVRP